MAAPCVFPTSSVLGVLQVKENGVCEVQTRLTNDFTLILTSNTIRQAYLEVFDVLPRLCGDLPPDATFRPDNGSCVAVDTPDGWQRGYVISVLDKNSYRIALCDSCCILTVKSNKLRSLPLKFLTIPAFGVKVVIEGDLQPSKAELIKPGVRFKFQIMRSNAKTATAVLTSTNIVNDKIFVWATLVPWVPRFEDKGLRCIKLKNKCKAQIMSYSSQHDIYLCPMDDYNVELRNRVIQDVVAYCEDAHDLELLPDPGELVACRFTSDEIYYRAQVIVCNREGIQVVYVDFGNVEYVTLDRLKPLSDELKQIPCTAVHVSLTNVRQCPLTMPAIHFFDMIILSDTEVVVNFTDSYLKGVTLTSDVKENINIMIDDFLTPSWKLALDSGEDCIGDAPLTVEEDIQYADLPEAYSFELFVLNKNDSFDFYGCAIDEIAMYGLKTLPKVAGRYCDEIRVECYTPRANELCLAMYGDEWLRAVCLRIEQIGCAVYFLDWGNTEVVSTSFIRKMPQEISDFPALASRCQIHGLPEKLSLDLRDKLEELIPLYSVHMAKVRLKKGETYYLDMPYITATLEEDGYFNL